MNSNKPTDHGKKSLMGGGLLDKLPKTLRGHVVAFLGELIGTLSFIFIAFAGTQTANVSSNPNTGTTVITTTAQKTPDQLLYISLSFGFSLAVNAWVFFRISGGLFNPAVTLGMVLIGAITWVRGILLFIAQMAGAIAGAYMVSALFTGALNVNTTLSATTSIAQGVLIEMMATTLLVFTIFMLAAEKHTGSFVAPVGIGLALFVSELVAVFWTGGSLNPARSFAPALVSGFETTQWVYWVGPPAGAGLAVVIFKIIKALEYETANADPESTAPTGPAGDPAVVRQARQDGQSEDEKGDMLDSYEPPRSAQRGDSSSSGALYDHEVNSTQYAPDARTSHFTPDQGNANAINYINGRSPANRMSAQSPGHTSGTQAKMVPIVPPTWESGARRNVEPKARTTPLPDRDSRDGKMLRSLR